MSYPKNREEWWKLVDDNWESLLSIMDRFLHLNHLAIDPPGKLDGKILMHSAFVDTALAKKARDGHRLCRYFNGAWREAPDKPEIHQIPAWDVLCDLCSEEWVLEEEDG